MKTKLIVALIAAAGFASAHAQSYVGGNLGRAEQKLDFGDGDIKDSDVSAKIYGGWKFNKTFAVEGGYQYLGKGEIGTNTDSLNARVQSIFVAAVATLPVNEDFSLFAKVGASRNRTKISGTGFSAYKENRTTPLLGIGAEYAFNAKISAIAEYENFGKVVKDNGADLKVDTLSYGLRFKF
ncbi:MAG: outer membrane beta-barrel protein [Gammaproteobacteria bacterium]